MALKRYKERDIIDTKVENDRVIWNPDEFIKVSDLEELLDSKEFIDKYQDVGEKHIKEHTEFIMDFENAAEQEIIESALSHQWAESGDEFTKKIKELLKGE